MKIKVYLESEINTEVLEKVIIEIKHSGWAQCLNDSKKPTKVLVVQALDGSTDFEENESELSLILDDVDDVFVEYMEEV